MRTWQEAWEILKPIPTDDYISGAWNEIRYNKIKALFELAGQVKHGTCIVDLGTWRGLAAFTLALGSDDSVKVYTLDDYNTRRVEEVANVGLTYNMADYEMFQANLAKMPADIQARITQQQVEVREAADTWQEPVGLVFWDLWGERLIDDIKAWTPHVVAGGLVVVKVFEDGRLKHERLYDLPDLEKDAEYPKGVIYTLRKKARATNEYAIWIVDGVKYLAEAQRSALSVQRHMPQVQAEIYMPRVRKHKEWFIEATGILCDALNDLPEGAKVLWLDSDTYVLESVTDLFEMLDRFDMCLAHAPGHVTAHPFYEIPDCFPEPQIGVIAFENCEWVRSLFSVAYEFQKNGTKTDQAALRAALWEAYSKAQHYAVIPCEYNFRFQFGGQVRDRVKILHGRAESAEEYEAIGKSVNAGYAEGNQIPPRLWGYHVP